MALPREHLLDELATAFVQAIAAASGATIAVSRRDYGVDGTLKHIVKAAESAFVESGFPVDFQLKGTTLASIAESSLRYDLKVRNYNLLVTRGVQATPYCLFLVCFNSEEGQWLVQEPERLILSASAYWWLGTGEPSNNRVSVRIRVPITQMLDVTALTSILELSRAKFDP